MPARGQGRGQLLLPAELLRRLYVVDELPVNVIAQRYGLSRQAVHSLIAEYALPRRSQTAGGAPRRPDPDLLYRWRVTEGLPPGEVAARLGLSRSALWSWMHRYGVPVNPIGLRRADDRPAPTPWVSQAELVRLWREQRCSAADIALRIGQDVAVVRDRLVAAGIIDAGPLGDYQPVGEPSDPLSRELLERLYLARQMTPDEIAVLTGTTPRKVQYRLVRYGIPRRRPGPRPILDDLTEELLSYLYVDREMSAAQIGGLLCCSGKQVGQRLAKYGIARRSGGFGSGGRTPLTPALLQELYVEQQISIDDIARRFNYVAPSGRPARKRVLAAIRRAGLSRPRPYPEIEASLLHEWYVEQGWTIRQIAEHLGWFSVHGKPAVGVARRQLLAAGLTPRREADPPRSSRSFVE